MAYDLEEQESLDSLKAWWERWGNLVLITICVLCVAFAGFNGWKWYQRNEGAKATAAYIELQNAFLTGDAKNVGSLATGLMKDYSSTVFAPMAAFIVAAEAQKQGKPDEARRDLNWVIEQNDHKEYHAVARIRLAGVELDAGKPEVALSALQAIAPEEQHSAAYLDRLGDVYLALKRPEDARKAWSDALAADKNQQAITALVTLKMASLPAVH